MSRSCSLTQRLVCHLGAQGEVETGEQSRTAHSRTLVPTHQHRLSGYEVDLRATPLPRSAAPACPCMPSSQPRPTQHPPAPFCNCQKVVFLYYAGGRDARVQYSVSCENKQVWERCRLTVPLYDVESVPGPSTTLPTPPLPPRCTLSAKVWSPRPYTPHHGSTASTWPISTCRPLSPSQEWTPSGHSGPQRKCCMRWWRGVLATAVLQRFNASAIAFPQR